MHPLAAIPPIAWIFSNPVETQLRERIKKWSWIAIAAMAITSSAARAQTMMAKAQWPTMEELLNSGKSAKPLSEAGLSAPELKTVQAALSHVATGKACRGANIEGCDALKSEFLERVQITTDGQAAVVLRGTSDCGTAGCPLWIVQLGGGRGLLLGDFGWGYAILPTHEHSYFDLVTAEGNHEVALTMWRFKGNRYQPFRCASMGTNSGSDSGAEEQVSEHPCRSSTP
jgi:hypothetical protein